MGDKKEATDLVRTFIDQRANSIHPIIAVPSHYVAAEQRYVLREEYNELEDTLDEYVEAMKKAQFNIEFDPKNCTWQDVLDQLYLAEQESELKQKTWHRKARRVIAKVGDDINPWLKLIPSENGLSVLNGGLAVFFQAVRRAESNRHDLLEALKDIPAAIQLAADKLTAFPSDIDLKNSVKMLYKTILEELPHLIELLLHRTQSTANSIKDHVGKIKRAKSDLDDRMTTLTQLSTVETLQGVRSVREVQDQSVLLQLSLHQDNRSQQEQLKNEILAAIGPKDAIAPKNALGRLLEDQLEEVARAQEQLKQILRRLEEQRCRARSPDFLSPNDVLDMLHVDLRKPATDLSYVLRQDISFDALSKGQARYLMQREEFKEWFFLPDPGLLAVNGNLGSSRGSKISPLSLVCAEMVKFLEGVDNEVILYFFCSENTMSEKGLPGPQKVMRSLLAQLLAYLSRQSDLLSNHHSLSLAFMESQRWQEQLRSLNLGTLCDTFWNLIQQMRPITVVCIIDGMSCYEKEEWRDDVLFLVGELEEMVRDAKLRPRLKILITYVTQATYPVEKVSSIWLRVGEISQRRVSERLEITWKE
ncbi:hypothetical protein FHL15_010656 [Xylaria flabelliformis]|uniref:Nephrocystin 3-like N-terminal domain-containing protein n=1 Tax=Xylaria flabelliformis TaxID=2512241 RepID=A0A553HKJ6_9PEZI|nr:hypothetical protein FHL15_010656 [Xylaria flabelliformis]